MEDTRRCVGKRERGTPATCDVLLSFPAQVSNTAGNMRCIQLLPGGAYQNCTLHLVGAAAWVILEPGKNLNQNSILRTVLKLRASEGFFGVVTFQLR